MPHDGDRMRGHGALLGAMDTTLHVTKSGTGRTATVVKANNSEEGECISFRPGERTGIGEDDTTAPVVVAIDQTRGHSVDEGRSSRETSRPCSAILHSAGSVGMTIEEWNTEAREAGIGLKRRPDLYDLRTQLKSKGLVREYGERWRVVHE